MSPEEWAKAIQELIWKAEEENMRFHIENGDFRIYHHDPNAGDMEHHEARRNSIFIW